MTEPKVIWAAGRLGTPAPIKIFEYPKVTCISAESDQITCRQVERALKEEYPELTFYAQPRGGFVTAQCTRDDETN